MATAQEVRPSEPVFLKSREAVDETSWYTPNIDKYLHPEVQQLLESYSGIPRDQQSKHVHEIRDKAWAIRTYPCTGMGIWLLPYITRSPGSTEILARLKAGASYAEIGCFLGVDMRAAVAHGADSTKMYGIDIVKHWDVGYELFRDKNRFHATFIEADLLADDQIFRQLTDKIDIISISAVLHLWNWETQVKVAKKLVSFSRPGTILFGWQLGNVEPKELFTKSLAWSSYRHNPTTMEQMWDQVGRETGTVWRTKAKLSSREEMGWDNDDLGFVEAEDVGIEFVITREK